MNSLLKGTLRLVVLAAGGSLSCLAAMGQAAAAPIVVDIAAPIVIKAVKPHKKSPYPKFEGTVMIANIAQITVRAKGNDLAIQTFSLSEEVATKMQAIIDKGGYQYGDKVTVFYDPTTRKAMQIKGKPSKPI
jgi:hypothetical protein